MHLLTGMKTHNIQTLWRAQRIGVHQGLDLKPSSGPSIVNRGRLENLGPAEEVSLLAFELGGGIYTIKSNIYITVDLNVFK